MSKNALAAEQRSSEKESLNGKSDRNETTNQYWFPVYEGLFERALDHFRCSLALHVAHRSYDQRNNGTGSVLGGIPINDGRPAGELGFPIKTVRRWRQMLVEGDYIAATRTPYGFIYTILKSKKWPARTLRELPKLPISPKRVPEMGTLICRCRQSECPKWE